MVTQLPLIKKRGGGQGQLDFSLGKWIYDRSNKTENLGGVLGN